MLDKLRAILTGPGTPHGKKAAEADLQDAAAKIREEWNGTPVVEIPKTADPYANQYRGIMQSNLMQALQSALAAHQQAVYNQQLSAQQNYAALQSQYFGSGGGGGNPPPPPKFDPIWRAQYDAARTLHLARGSWRKRDADVGGL